MGFYVRGGDVQGISKIYSSRLYARNSIATPLPNNEGCKQFFYYAFLNSIGLII